MRYVVYTMMKSKAITKIKKIFGKFKSDTEKLLKKVDKDLW